MTLLDTASRLLVRPQEQVPRAVSRGAVARAIASETRFGYKRALIFVDSMRHGLQSALDEGCEYWLPDTEWLHRNHEILVTIAPDHQRSTPGSAHALLEDHILDRSKGQLGIVHDMRREHGLRHCAVSVITESVAI